MNDRELLQKAAKAAGVDFSIGNPLENDGDALRLAVKLKLIVDPWGCKSCTVKYRNPQSSRTKELWSCGGGGMDSTAATRRAITTAAAKLADL